MKYKKIKRYKRHILKMVYLCNYEMEQGNVDKARYFAMHAWVGLKKCPYALSGMGLIRPVAINNGYLIIVDRYGNEIWRFNTDRLIEIKKSHEVKENNDG